MYSQANWFNLRIFLILETWNNIFTSKQFRNIIISTQKYPCIPDFKTRIHEPTAHKHSPNRFFVPIERLHSKIEISWNVVDENRLTRKTRVSCADEARLRLGLHPFRRVSLAFFLRSFLSSRLVSSRRRVMQLARQ